jgi:hypothetical protein
LILALHQVYTIIVYTGVVADSARGFDWDVHNVGHVARHGVNPVEVEEAFERPHVIIPAEELKGEKNDGSFSADPRPDVI